MYCKYCGKPLPDGAKHCPACGRAFSASASKSAAPEKGSNTVLYLFIALMVLPQLFSLRFGSGATLFGLISLVRALISSAIGVAALFALIQKGRILPGQLRGQDLLMWVLWSFPSGWVSTGIFTFVGQGLGIEALVGYTTARNMEGYFCDLSGLWSWVLLILLCMARSGRLRLTKKAAIKAALLLAGWSLLLFVLCVPLTAMMTHGLEAHTSPELVLMAARVCFATLFIRHGFAAAYMVLYGSERLRPGLDIIFAVVPAVLSLLFAPLMIFTFRLGLPGAELARLLAALVSWGLLLALRSRESIR